jgi:hypothetical protein
VSAAPVTFNGHAAVMSNADTWIHLAELETEPGARSSLCFYTAPQLREATRRELNVSPDSTLGRGFCTVCAYRAGIGPRTFA